MGSNVMGHVSTFKLEANDGKHTVLNKERSEDATKNIDLDNKIKQLDQELLSFLMSDDCFLYQVEQDQEKLQDY